MKKRDVQVWTCVKAMRKLCAGRTPLAYVISGSGQKKMLEHFNVLQTVPFARLPGFPELTVKGHSGTVSLCSWKGRHFLLQGGRSHLYESGEFGDVLFPLDVAKALGVGRVLLMNSSGGVSRSLRAGDVMLITDQINLMARNSLFARKGVIGNERFVPMRPCYDPGFLAFAKKYGKGLWKAGVYAGMTGPAYETEAELAMLERLGADAVGMSTVQEAIYARFLRLEVSGVSLISNARSGATDHDDVVATTEKSLGRLAEVIKAYLEYNAGR
jgi:purine-nucleoside phosphorylase